MMSIAEELNNHQLPNAKVSTAIPAEQVDVLADELVRLFNNPQSRNWYCGVIYKYGISRVLEWKRRSIEGNYPPRLFTYYVNQAGGYRRNSNVS